MNSKNRQRGISIWSLAGLLVIGGFSVIIGLKLIPVYLESYKIDKGLKATVNDSSNAAATNREVEIALSKRLDIDGVTRITDTNFKEYGSVVRDQASGRLTIEVYYQAEVPLFGNLTLIADFEKSASN